MTSDEIIRMAREAGEAEGMRVVFHPVMERFAALVAAAEREAAELALTDEDIDQITRDRWGTQLLGVMVQAHREYARAILRAALKETK